MNKRVFSQSWFIRKAAYYVIGLIVLGLAAFGVVDQVQAENVMAAVQEYAPLIVGGALNLVAGARTNEGSDSKVTEADLAAARREALADAAGGLAEKVARTVEDRVDKYFNPAPDGGVALPVYSGPTTTA